jgi:hypothetical protein
VYEISNQHSLKHYIFIALSGKIQFVYRHAYISIPAIIHRGNSFRKLGFNYSLQSNYTENKLNSNVGEIKLVLHNWKNL